MGDLAKRLATAAVLVPIVLSAILLDPTIYGVIVLAAVVAALANDEYLRMAQAANADTHRLIRVVGALGSLLLVAITGASSASVAWPLVFAVVPLLVGVTVLARPTRLEHAGRNFALLLSGWLYVPTQIAFLPLLKRSGGSPWLIVLLCLAFFSDTVAYFFGKLFGRHKLYPEVSPKKTWEGSVGGLLGGTLATVGVGSLWLLPSLPLGHAIVLGCAGSVAGQVGDLLESLLKRNFGAKDSGTILPGHGGMLDRIDAMLFVTPVVYGYLYWSSL